MRKMLLTIFSLFTLINSYSQVQEAWKITGIDFIYASPVNPCLVIDGNGNVIAGVKTFDFGSGDGLEPTFIISKYTSSGTKVFETLESVEVFGKELVAMAVDAAGSIYCSVWESRTLDPVNAVLGGLFALYKYSSTGAVLWKRSYGDGQLNIPHAIALDAAGNVYLTGTCKVSGALITDELPDYLTVKWNSAGERQWAKRYDGASPGEGANIAQAIMVDGSGNVYVTGSSQRDGQIGYGTIKYNSAGTLLWEQRYTGLTTANDRALAITRDVSGFIYVTGISEGAIATVKYNNDGAQIWAMREGSGGAEGRVIRVDGSGNVYVAGISSSTQLALLKYNFAGTKQWIATKPGAAFSMDLDGLGNIYVAGRVSGDGATIKYNSSGVQQWIKTYDSPLLPGVNDPVAVSSLENLYVINFTSSNRDGNANARYRADLIKYTQCDIICPGNITVNTTAGQCGAIVNYSVSTTGDCGSTITYSHASGSVFPKGLTTVTVTSEETGETCSFTVTVRDVEAPVAKCKNITVPLDATSNAIITALQVDNSSTDNCGIQSRTLSKTTFNCSNVGANTVTLTVTDVNGNSNTCTATVTIQDNTPPTAMCKNITAYLDASGGVSITTAEVDNGSTDVCGAVTLSLSKTVFTCADKGANSPVLTVTDPNGNSATCTPIVTVLDTLPPIISSVVATPGSLWPSDRKMKPVTIAVTATDNCGVYTWRITNVVIKAGAFANDNVNPDSEITGNNTVNLRAEIPKRGIKRVYTVIITCTDASGNSSTSSTDVAVSHNITGPGSGAITLIGSTVNLSGEFWDLPGNTHTAKWLIDNNTSSRATVIEPSDNANGTVAGVYKFNNAGVYKLQMNVTDQNGVTRYTNTNENLDAIVVVYDPNGGYTYGGGNFYSPAGSLRSNSTLAGDVSYGFSVNYYKGAKLPKGETQFDFKLGDFEYNALNFEYLAINSSTAQFKGTGKIIGGQSGVGFTMTVVDGQLDGTGIDKIRMKIYNKNNGAIIYDNQPGASDAALPTQAVGTNSVIVISGSNSSLTSANKTQTAPIEAKPEDASSAIDVTAFPNPSSGNFTINVKGNGKEKITMQVIDMYGRVIETRNVNTNSILRFGDRYRPGTYFVRIIQGKEHKEIKLIKISD